MGAYAERVCDKCGTKFVEYPFTFNAHYLDALYKIARAGGPVRIANLPISKAQYTNIPKMKYWGRDSAPFDMGLVVPFTGSEEARHKAGWWQITAKGVAFLKGQIEIRRKIVLMRKPDGDDDALVRFEGDLISARSDLTYEWGHTEDYREIAREQIQSRPFIPDLE